MRNLLSHQRLPKLRNASLFHEEVSGDEMKFRRTPKMTRFHANFSDILAIFFPWRERRYSNRNFVSRFRDLGVSLNEHDTKRTKGQSQRLTKAEIWEKTEGGSTRRIHYY